MIKFSRYGISTFRFLLFRQIWSTKQKKKKSSNDWNEVVDKIRKKEGNKINIVIVSTIRNTFFAISVNYKILTFSAVTCMLEMKFV